MCGRDRVCGRDTKFVGERVSVWIGRECGIERERECVGERVSVDCKLGRRCGLEGKWGGGSGQEG